MVKSIIFIFIFKVETKVFLTCYYKNNLSLLKFK